MIWVGRVSHLIGAIDTSEHEAEIKEHLIHSVPLEQICDSIKYLFIEECIDVREAKDDKTKQTTIQVAFAQAQHELSNLRARVRAEFDIWVNSFEAIKREQEASSLVPSATPQRKRRGRPPKAFSGRS